MPRNKAYIADIQDIQSDIRILLLQLPHRRRLDFLAGQFIDITSAGFEPRSYSIANAPGEDFIEIHVRSTGHNGFSDFLCEDIKPGDILDISSPKGDAFFNSNDDTPLYLIAGGTGISYTKSILEQALKQKHKSPIHFIWGNDTDKEFYLDTHLKSLSLKHKNLSYISTTTRLDKKLKQILPDLMDEDIYLAGPQNMVEECGTVLLQKGALRDNILCDMDF